MLKVTTSTDIKVSELTDYNLNDLFFDLNTMKLEFRNELTLSSDSTFGNEIEVNDLSLNAAEAIVENFNDTHLLNPTHSYDAHEELTASAEIVTPIMKDDEEDWENFYEMCNTINMCGATYGNNTSSHIHVGTHLIDTPEKLSLLLKTLVVFEPIIFKFGYGYDENPRSFITYQPHAANYSMMMSPRRTNKFIEYLDSPLNNNDVMMELYFNSFLAPNLKIRNVFNFFKFDFEKFYHDSLGIVSERDHMEVRCFNSAPPEIVQNNINLICHIIECVANDKIDKKYVLSEYEKYKKKRYDFDYFCTTFETDEKGLQYNRLLNGFNKVKLEKALKLADMIFDNELDKYYFLKQYLKLYNKDDEYILSLTKKDAK